MSLKDLVKNMDFDPSKDSIQDENTGLPSGEYDVILKNIQFKAYDSGYEAIVIIPMVLTGEHADQEEFINVNLDENYEAIDKQTGQPYLLYQRYPNLLNRSLKMISKLAYICGVTLTDDDWEDMVTISEAFVRDNAKGTQFILIVDRGVTKKGKEYVNYEFETYDETTPDPLANQVNNVEVSEDDIPF